MYSHPMFMYDRKRTYQAMEAFGMPMDSVMCHPAAASYYTHLQTQPAALKYPKLDPTYYPTYAEDPERYQANITVSVQSQVPTSFGGSSSTTAIGYSGYTTYSNTPHTVFGSVATTDTSNTVHSFTAQPNLQSSAMPQVATASAVSAMSPVRSATVDEGPTMSTPLTPPLSVSPVSAITAASPQRIASSQTMPNSYLERENTIGYRSASASPCVAGDCDSTTNNDILDHKLPLHVLSDLSEGLPLPGM